MPREFMGVIETLADACRARRMLWAFCLNCGHARRLDPRNVMLMAGELTVRDLARRLKCQRCGKRRSHVVPNDEEWVGR